jgi:hypothetical protein
MWMMVLPGCSGKVDWSAIEDIAMTAVKEFVAQQLIIAKTKFIDDGPAIKGWALKRLHDSKLYMEAKAALDKYNVSINEEAIVEQLYNIILANWQAVLNEKGFDTDADAVLGADVIYFITPGMFPEIYDVQIE